MKECIKHVPSFPGGDCWFRRKSGGDFDINRRAFRGAIDSRTPGCAMALLNSRRARHCPLLTVMAAEAGVRSGATLSGLLCSLLILLSGVFPDATESAANPGEAAELNTRQAIERLSLVFGLEKVPTHAHHRSPPEYMVDLYQSVAFSDGITKTAAPFDADVVRGFPDKGKVSIEL